MDAIAASALEPLRSASGAFSRRLQRHNDVPFVVPEDGVQSDASGSTAHAPRSSRDRFEASRDVRSVGTVPGLQRTFELNKQAIDDVLLDPRDIQREQLIRTLLLSDEEKIDKGASWGHPEGEAGGFSSVWRYMRYWLGPFGSTRHEFAYFQPVNDLMSNMESSHLTPGMCFDAFFGVFLLQITLAEPENAETAQHLAFKVSSVIFALATPIALLLPPVTVMHVRVLSCVARPRMRKFLGK